MRLLAGLGAQERRVLVLRYVYDLTEAAIADELGMSRGTVKSAASRRWPSSREPGTATSTGPHPRP